MNLNLFYNEITLGELTMDGTNDLSNAKVYDKVQFIEHIFF
jgi:hypothetical protein